VSLEYREIKKMKKGSKEGKRLPVNLRRIVCMFVGKRGTFGITSQKVVAWRELSLGLLERDETSLAASLLRSKKKKSFY